MKATTTNSNEFYQRRKINTKKNKIIFNSTGRENENDNDNEQIVSNVICASRAKKNKNDK